jgi:hypothetical protein
MKTFLHGNDKGNAVLISVTLILIFSIAFLSFVPYMISMKRNAAEYKESIISDIKKSNEELIKEYDLH